MANKNVYDEHSIMVLEGLEAVRLRPGMYIGSTGRKGLHHLIYEIVDNAVDEHLAGYCSEIRVTLERDGSCTVEDNGRGIPVGIHEKGMPAERLVFTTLHAGGKFDESVYKTSGGLHGVGSSVVNALSEHLDVWISVGGSVYHDRFKRGIPDIALENGLPPVVGKTKATGTRVNFLPDEEIFEKTVFSAEEVISRLHETAYLNGELTIRFRDLREDGEELVFHEPEGIVSYVRSLTENLKKVSDPIYIKGESEGITVEAAFQYSDEFHENVLGFCNNIYNADGGTHITGFKTAFTTVMNNYAREIGMLKDKDANFTGTDIRNGMTAVISVKHPSPRFEGQTKTKLDNPDAARVTAKVVSDELPHYFDRNLGVLKNVLACAEKSAKIRKAEERVKTDLLSKPKYPSFDSNGKLANCEKRDPKKCEIFIVEGDSAGGSAKTARDRSYQAILPIRGKILNVEKASMDKILQNAEIKSMISAFGCGFSEGYGDNFDISKLRYDKIIIMADADVDGAHIATLLLTLFYRFMPDLISEGHVYIAMPPLYKVMPQNGKEEYLYDDKALERYRKTHKGKFTLQRYKGLGEMNPEQLWETTLDPERRRMRRVEIGDARMASSLTEILMGTEVQPRKEFIYRHAREAEITV